MKMRSHIASIVFLLGACGTASAVEWPPVLNPDANVQPPKWDWQLKSSAQLNEDSSIEIYDIDMFLNETNGVVDQLKNNGKKIICYVNVGAWEDWRDDKHVFPPGILGNVYDRFPDEKWLDIRDVNPAKSNTGMALRQILRARFDRALQMGCDAVEPDNMDGFDDSSHNPSGFPLTYEDQIYFNLWISQEVRNRGMLIGFKNNTNQALDQRMVDAFDFVVTESCVFFDECQYFAGFLNANKPVFLTEYLMDPEQFCATAKNLRISAIKKRGALDTYRLSCDSYYSTQPEPEPEPEPQPNPQPNPSQAATNLLANGGFESGLQQWQACSDPSSLSINSTASQGNKALTMSGGSACLYQEVPVNAGEEYTLWCDASRQNTAWSIVQLSYVDAQYNNLTTEIKQVATGGTYGSYSITDTAPPNTRYGVALLYSEDQMLVDNCILSSAIEPEPEPEPQPEPAPQPEPQPEPEPSVTNLLTNGSFESDLFGWLSCGNADNLSISNNTSQGNKALEFVRGPGCLYQEVSVNVGATHTLSCQATRQNTAWSIVQFTYLDAQYNALATQTEQLATNGTYTTYAMTGTAPANTRYALALLYSEDNTLVDNCVLSRM